MSSPTDPPGIVELGDICDDHAARARGWFETLGRWTRDEPDGRRQRTWATAAHRHAWHADLWVGRRPAIPPVAERPVPPPRDVAADAGVDERAATYRSALSAWRTSLAELRARLDPDLDPSTVRVVDLVTADLDDLLAHARGAG